MISLEWLGGFFDGEGCVQIGIQHHKNGKSYPCKRILLGQSGEDGLVILQQIQADYGGQIYHHLKPGQHKATKNAYKLYWRAEEGAKFLEQLIPHLKLKQKAAQEVLDYCRRLDAKRTIQE